MQVKKFFALMIFWMSASCALGAPIYYADLMDPPRQLIFDRDKISALGISSPLKICEPEEEFICFDGGGLRFAVPKMVRQKKSWIFAGQRYSIHKIERFSMVGSEVEVIFIKKPNDSVTYLYSEDRGVIGFGVIGKRPRFFLLENKCGFGAPLRCVK